MAAHSTLTVVTLKRADPSDAIPHISIRSWSVPTRVVGLCAQSISPSCRHLLHSVTDCNIRDQRKGGKRRRERQTSLIKTIVRVIAIPGSHAPRGRTEICVYSHTFGETLRECRPWSSRLRLSSFLG